MMRTVNSRGVMSGAGAQSRTLPAKPLGNLSDIRGHI